MDLSYETLTAGLAAPKLVQTIQPITAGDLMRMDIPPRQTLLSPWLPQQGIALLYASRGVGKTFAAMSIAYAVASGGQLMRWKADAARRVLYVDGEMPLVSLQERLASIAMGAGYSPPTEDFLSFLAQDAYRDGFPDVASPDGRKLIERTADGCDLVVFDNLSSLVKSPENEADSWGPMQDLVLSLRRRGTTSLMIHHAGKGGDQRGTSRREDVADTVVKLARPEGYDPKQGAQFEVHYTKTRGFTGADAAPFLATLHSDPKTGIAWEHADIGADAHAMAEDMFATGGKASDVMKALGVTRPTAYRWQKEWKAAGNG
jgi:putative DNA primase/helicase